ncbi:MAG: 50S ribosomal protein L5 [Candidatus Spechtbacterales bacterium]|nr:50S ribosomal protein L5 [Candidatus Spechtbacterales bacterium]
MSETLDLQKNYNKNIKPELAKELGGLNIFEVPKLEKIVLNAGVGKISAKRKGSGSGSQTDEEMLSDLVEGLASISGQKPQLVRAKKSIAGFKLREGMPAGLKVTLRGKKMYDFMARLINVALPRTRDFRGISKKSVDSGGNLTIGVKESSIFPEVESGNFNWGFEATFVTNTKEKEKALELFEKLGVPFEKEDQ